MHEKSCINIDFLKQVVSSHGNSTVAHVGGMCSTFLPGLSAYLSSDSLRIPSGCNQIFYVSFNIHLQPANYGPVITGCLTNVSPGSSQAILNLIFVAPFLPVLQKIISVPTRSFAGTLLLFGLFTLTIDAIGKYCLRR